MKSISERRQEKKTKAMVGEIEETTGVAVEIKKKSSALPYVHMIVGTPALIGLSFFLPAIFYTPLCLIWVVSGVVICLK